MIDSIIKRNGTVAPFDTRKISSAIYKANISVSGESMTEKHIEFLTNVVTSAAEALGRPTVEQIQDIVEETLIKADYAKTAKAYILYRAEHAKNTSD